jgi:mono/diheme cytochrome c family protein
MRLFTVFLLAGVLCTHVGCRSVRRGEPIVGPLNSSDPEVQKGRLVFQEHCSKCHPGGEGGLGPALNDKLAPRSLMKTQVRLGLGAMPSFHKQAIPPDDLDALTKYIVAQRKQAARIVPSK